MQILQIREKKARCEPYESIRPEHIILQQYLLVARGEVKLTKADKEREMGENIWARGEDTYIRTT